MARVGVQIGDQSLVWSFAGETTRVPARVGALVRSGTAGSEISYLLAGDEAAADAEAVRWPRRAGYRWSDERSSAAIVQALLARVRQGLPPGAPAPLVLAVPFWVQQHGPALVAAALEAGWPEVTLVTDLHALVRAAAGRVSAADVVVTLVPGSELIDAGAWRLAPEGWLPLAWEQWPRASALTHYRQLLDRVGALRPVAVLGGDLASECDLPDVVNLGPGAVAEAAAAWDFPPALPSTRLHVALETAAGPLPLPGPTQAQEAWRALKGAGLPATVRVTGWWGAETAKALVLWEQTVAAEADPLLLHLRWEGEAAAAVRVVTASGGEICRGALSMRLA